MGTGKESEYRLVEGGLYEKVELPPTLEDQLAEANRKVRALLGSIKMRDRLIAEIEADKCFENRPGLKCVVVPPDDLETA